MQNALRRIAVVAISLAVSATAQETKPAERYEDLGKRTADAMARGDYAQAASLAEQALAISRELGDRKREAQALGRAGTAWLYKGDYGQARRFLEAALELARQLGDREGQVRRLNNLGSIDYFQGNYQRALAEYRQAEQVLSQPPDQEWTARLKSVTAVNVATLYQRLGLHERALEEYRKLQPFAGALKTKEQAQRLTNIGVLYRHLGDPYKALDCYQRVRQMYARDRDHYGELGALEGAGIALVLDLRDYRTALRTFDEVLALAAKTGSRWEAMQARLYRAETLRRMGRPATGEFEAALAAARELRTPEEEWKALFALGRVKEAALLIEGLRQQAPGGALRGQFLAEKREVYDAVIAESLRQNDAEGFLQWSERARARLLRDELGKTLPLETRLNQLQAQLDPDALLLVYWTGAHQGGVLWATRQQSGLLAREPADLREFLQAVSSPNGGDWRRRAEAVGARLLGGILPLQAGAVRQVIVVPDGLLQVVPFEALQAPGRAKLLVEEATVTYLPTASLLARRPERNWWRPPWRRSLVALAAERSSDPLEQIGLLPPLAGATREVQAIAGLLPGRALLLTGEAAGKSALAGAATGRVPLIHLAAHAAVSEERPERSRILLAREAVFLGEAGQLDLRGTDLVTLSACETERGRLVQGEGIRSFSRAFLAAGARAVVTTLWRVADRPTATFMEVFYYHLARGRNKADALTEAKRKFLRSGTPLAHPYYWAAFVINGEGWRPAPLPVGWAPLLALAGLALVVLIAAAHRLSHRGDRLKPQNS